MDLIGFKCKLQFHAGKKINNITTGYKIQHENQMK